MFGILNVCCWSLTPTHAAHASGFPRSVLSVPTFGSTARGIPGSCSPSVSQWSPFHWGASKYNKYRLVQKWGILQNSPFNIIYIYIYTFFERKWHSPAMGFSDFRPAGNARRLPAMWWAYSSSNGLGYRPAGLYQWGYPNSIAGWFMEHHGNSYFYQSGTSWKIMEHFWMVMENPWKSYFFMDDLGVLYPQETSTWRILAECILQRKLFV